MRKEADFQKILKVTEGVTEKAVTSRLGKARKAEEILGNELDDIVNDNDFTFDALKKLKEHENSAHSPLSNALRKYYKFINEKEFPRLKQYKGKA